MSEESNDVTKALAAFGAPSIRYHSFGQAQIKSSGTNAMRRPVMPPVSAPSTSPAMVQQEPVAAVEALPTSSLPQATPIPMVAPRPAPFLAEPAPMRAAPLFPSTPTVAPPPRPLAEWAAPVTTSPSRPSAASVPPPAEPVYVTTPPVAAPATPPPPPPVAYTPPAAPLAPGRTTMPNSLSSLPEIFDYLAAS